LPAQANYLLGADPAGWRTGVALYARATYRELYPGIDLIFHGSDRSLEYDFLLRPGADAHAIALDVSGAADVRVESDGTLAIATPAGPVIRWKKPEVYQLRNGAREPVAGRFVVRRNRVTFALGAYDHRRTLVIDPTLAAASYLGGSADDAGRGIAVDANGNAYVTGYTFSRDIPSTGGTQQPAWKGGTAGRFFGGDAFVAKYTSAGALVWVTYLGGSNDDVGDAVAVDSSGNVYVTGYTNSTDFPTTSAAFQKTFQGRGTRPATYFAPGGDAFVTKLNPSGSALIYSTYLGGKDDDKGIAIAVDSAGNAAVGGVTLSTNFPTQNPYQSAFKGFGGIPDLCFGCGPVQNFGDGFVAVLNPAGSALVFSTYLGGSNDDTVTSIAVDGSGNVYAGGTTLSTDFPVSGAYQSKFGGSANLNIQPVLVMGDGWVAKFSPAGKLVYSTFLGGSRDDAVMGLAVDSAGSVYVTGFTSSPDFPTTKGAAQTTYHGPNALTGQKGFIWGDAFVTKLTPAGNSLVYSTYLGGADDDAGGGIAVDAAGNAYVAGFANSRDFPVSADALQKSFAGKSTDPDTTGDAFLAKISSDGGTIVFSTYYGGSLDDAATGIALDTQGSAYVIGTTMSSNLPVAGPGPSKFHGSAADSTTMGDAFVLQISGLFSAAPVSTITAVVNAASLDNRLSPGCAATVMGNNLGSSPLAGAMVGGTAAQVVSASPSSWSVVIPARVLSGATTIQVGSTPPFNITLSDYAPALYSADGSGTGLAAVTHASGGGAVTASSPAMAGENVIFNATGLAGATAAQIAATVGGTGATVAAIASGNAGGYQVTVQLPATLASGSLPVTLAIGNNTSNTVTLPVIAASSGPVITGIVNAATLQANAAAPSDFVNIQVTNLGASDSADNIFPAMTFQGVSVLINGAAVPLSRVSGSQGQISLVLPSELPASGTVNVQVQNPAGTSAGFSLAMAPEDVGMYRVADPSNPNRINGDVHFTNDAWRVMAASMAAALGLPSCGGADPAAACAQPAKSGDQIVIYLTGLGKATPNGDPNGQPLPTGTLAPTDGSVVYQTVDAPAVTIGGVTAQVSLSAIVPGNAGLYQIQTSVPDGVQAGDDVPVVVAMPGGSSDTVTIAVSGN
jgi:uncharacterized protein (TIGR03437 family)